MTARVILLNGPPRSGKDTVVRTFSRSLGGQFVHDKLSLPMKRAFAGLMGATVHADLNVYPYEDNKSAIIPVLGVSFRQWQIDFAEKLMRPTYGKDVFIKLLMERLSKYQSIQSNTYVLVSDCGFQLELDILEQHFYVHLIRLHRDGCTYDGDSRSYVTANRYTDIVNNGSMLDLHEKVVSAVTGDRVYNPREERL